MASKGGNSPQPEHQVVGAGLEFTARWRLTSIRAGSWRACLLSVLGGVGNE